MSYILEALRKAESQREQHSVPGVFSPTQATPSARHRDGPPARGSHATLLWAAATATALLLGGLIWWVVPAGSPPASSQPAQVMAHATPDTPPTPPQQVAPMPRTPPPDQTEAHAPMGPARRPQPDAAPGTRPPPEEARPASRPSAPPASTVATSSAADRLGSANELPEAIRRSLPTLVIGGAMYSDVPANRMLIINSQVFHEGDKPADDLVLESIRLKSAVFNFKGHRYSVSY